MKMKDDKIFDLEFFKNLRFAMDFTQTDFAALIGIQRSYLNRVESGRQRLTALLLGVLGEKINISAALMIFACLPVPDELFPIEEEFFRNLRAIARGKLIAALEGKTLRKRDPKELERIEEARGWIL